jgi:hypothetical protein
MPSTRTRPAQRAAGQENAIVTDVANPSATPAPQADATPANGTPSADANGASANGTAGKSKRNVAPIQITVPLDLKQQIKTAAEAAGKTEARWVLENIAGDLQYSLPEATRASTSRGGVKMTDVFAKDLTPEQKKTRLAEAKTLLEALAKGVINLADIKAKLGTEDAPATT